MSIDQSRVTSGYDLEILLGQRYLQYLLLLGLDTGAIPVQLTFGADPVVATLSVPPQLDRTYPPDPQAVQPVPSNRDDAMGVEILDGHPLGADLRVTLWLDLFRPSDGASATLDLQLFVRLALDAPHDPGGGLASAGLGVTVVDVGGALLAIAGQNGVPPDELLAAVKAQVDRTLDLGGLGSGRLEDVALRKHPAADGAPAGLGVYLNMRLKAGPQADRFVAPRGDVLAAQNLLPDDPADPATDIVFATRADIFGDLAADAYHRKAESVDGGFRYPWYRKPSDPKSERLGTIVGVDVGPAPQLVNRLRISTELEYTINNFPDPNFTYIVDVFTGVDADGVMTWDSEADASMGLLAHFLLALAAVLVGAFLGPGVGISTFIALETAEAIVVSELLDDTAQDRVDKTLADISPTRLTVQRKRWDPFYDTHHQIGLRPGGSAVNDRGLVVWGTACLTKRPQPRRGLVIREAEVDAVGAPTALLYRVHDVDPASADLTAVKPATDRRPFTNHTLDAEPNLFSVTVGDAVTRLADKQLVGEIPYLVRKVDMTGGTVTALLCISVRERDEQANRLLGEHADAAFARITADEEPAIRQQVLDEFAAAGVIPTAEQVDAKVAAEVARRVGETLAAYQDVGGAFAADLDAALEPLLRFELSPHQMGVLQDKGLLKLKDFVLVQVKEDERFYYRDRFVRPEEPTKPRQLADNLPNKPRYDSALPQPKPAPTALPTA